MTTTTGSIATAGQVVFANVNPATATSRLQFNNLSSDILIIAYNGSPPSRTNGLIVAGGASLVFNVGDTSLAYPGYISVWGPMGGAPFSIVVT
jgi:hypothetical protein